MMKFDPPLQTHLLKTERLQFRHLLLSDAEEWSPFCASEEANRYFMPVEEPPLQAARTFIGKTQERWEEGGTGFCVLAEKNSGAIVGLMGLLTQVVDGEPELEIGYRLLPQHWKKGYAIEAAKKFRDFAFENRLAESIISIVHIDNVPSQRVAERNGMRRTKQTVFREIFPVFIYRITREEWEKLPAR